MHAEKYKCRCKKASIYLGNWEYFNVERISAVLMFLKGDLNECKELVYGVLE